MKKIEKALEVVSIVLMVMLTSIITIQVFSRVLHTPIFWSEEFARICLIYLTYISGAYAYSKGKGLRIMMFVEKLPIKIQKNINIITSILSLIVMLVIVYSSILFTQQLWGLTTTALKWQKSILTLVIPISFALLFMKWLQDTFKLIKDK